jgi:hypothetical protein
MRFRKHDPAHNLLTAVAHWVREKGGSTLVIGGIEVQDWDEGAYKFRVAVRCLGTKPPKPRATDEKA